MKRFILSASLVAVAVGGAYFAKKRLAADPRRPNILIISNCSIRWDQMSMYGSSGNTTPNLQKFSEGAFVLWNAFTDKGWSNVSGFLQQLSREEVEKSGYVAAGMPWSQQELWRQKWVRSDILPPPYMARIPQDRPHLVRDEAFEEDLSLLKKLIFKNKDKPFLLEIHSKFMHVPYNVPLYQVSAGAGGIRGRGVMPMEFLSKESRALFEEYTSHPEKHLDKLPVLIYIGISGKVADAVVKHPFVRQALASAKSTGYMLADGVSLLMEDALIDAWRKTRGFEADVRLVQELYRSRLRYMDAAFKDLLDLYGDKDLQKNTVIIFMGDHGETFGAHGRFAHSTQVYDEDLRFPMIVRFPGVSGRSPRNIHSQFYQGTMLDVVRGIMSGSLSSKNFAEFVENNPKDRTIFSRNCQNTLHGVRSEGKWKMIMNLATGSSELYDLTKDPGETLNVYKENPDTAARLEELLNDYGGLSGNRMLGQCAVNE